MGLSIALALCSAVITRANARATSNKKSPWERIITVDKSGKGDFKKIQDAINDVPSNNVHPIFIRVEAGIYKEKITIPADKPLITLSGRNAETTVITWNDSGDIIKSATFTVLASDFVGRHLTIQNTYGSKGKAVALRVAGDKAEFKACRILSYQDTLLDETGRHFYSNCYIEGATDFICGNANSLFQKCHLHSTSEKNGAITAQQRKTSQEKTGFYFVRCKITGVKSCTLGRPWGPYSRVVYAQSYLSSAVLPQGWDDWGKTSTHRTAFYGEYMCFGPGANRTKRVQWSHSLTDQEVSALSLSTDNGKSWIMAFH
ncbi:hypothetical protein vseg_009537 [Gypsophila vaccaria]